MDFLLKSVLSVHWVLCGHDTWNPPRPWKEAGPKDFQTMKKSAVEDQGGKSTKGYQTFLSLILRRDIVRIWSCKYCVSKLKWFEHAYIIILICTTLVKCINDKIHCPCNQVSHISATTNSFVINVGNRYEVSFLIRAYKPSSWFKDLSDKCSISYTSHLISYLLSSNFPMVILALTADKISRQTLYSKHLHQSMCWYPKSYEHRQ